MQSTEDWDDSIILKTFHNAISTHRMQGQPVAAQQLKRKRDNTSLPPEAEEGEKKGIKSLLESYSTSKTRQTLLQSKEAKSVSFDVPTDNQHTHAQPQLGVPAEQAYTQQDYAQAGYTQDYAQQYAQQTQYGVINSTGKNTGLNTKYQHIYLTFLTI